MGLDPGCETKTVSWADVSLRRSRRRGLARCDCVASVMCNTGHVFLFVAADVSC